MSVKRNKKAIKKTILLYLLIPASLILIFSTFIGGEYLLKRTFYLKEHTQIALEHRNLPLIYTKDSLIYMMLPFVYDVEKLVKNGMPEYNIKIKNNDLNELRAQCDRVLVEATVTGDAEGVVSKESVPAKILIDNEWIDIELKLRGRWENHFRREHPSLKLKFPDEILPDGIGQINLSAPMDKKPISDVVINEEMAGQGFLTLRSRFVLEIINDRVVGIFQEIEQPGKSLADRNGRVEGYIFGGDGKPFIEDDTEKFERAERAVMILSDFLYNNKGTYTDVLNVIDVDKFSKAVAITALLNSNHAWVGDNLRLFYDPARGKLEPIPWDYMIFSIHGDSKKPYPEILNISSFNCAYKRELKHLLDNRIDGLIQSGDEKANIYIEQLENARHDGIMAQLLKIDYLHNIAKSRSEWNEENLMHEYKTFFQTIKENASELRKIIGSDDFETQCTDEPIVKLTDLPEGVSVSGKNVYFGPGIVTIDKTIELPDGYNVYFQPGLNLRIYKGVNLVINGDLKSVGSDAEKIIVDKAGKENWGSIAVFGSQLHPAKVLIKNTEFDGGAGGLNERHVFNSGLYIVDADVDADGLEVNNGIGDDGINIVYSKVHITNSKFTNNSGDGLDLDFCNGDVKNNVFTDSGGDALDLSGSRLNISGNIFKGCGDKGISAGERTVSDIYDNTIKNCVIGVASKDGSDIQVKNVTIENTETGVAVYRKKLTFGKPQMQIDNLIMKDVHNAVYIGTESFFNSISSYSINDGVKTDINEIVKATN